jgi:hypothetical protein
LETQAKQQLLHSSLQVQIGRQQRFNLPTATQDRRVITMTDDLANLLVTHLEVLATDPDGNATGTTTGRDT